MFFKRLDLHGFKSFGHKVTIDFQPGFTIVVGPNGCGKSNVLDGIRWVLGETSAKALRGGRMGDVVFRGTQTMKPAGLSQVTLTCDNSAGLLKIDTQEVAITRRLFASGDSEYLINKVKCRMRDVHDLFLDTGLGADGYSVIEQGQIGQMVAAKPNERRDIFEEAAGISRYKVRREETLRKLERTSEDLVRLQDLVGEVERQCNSLKYQARKAQRHRRLSRRLVRLQQRLVVMRHRALGEEFARADEKRRAARDAFEQASAAVATAEARGVELQRQADEAAKRLQSLQARRFEVRGKLDAERHRAELAGQKIRTAEERVAAIDRELEARRSRQSIVAQTIDALEADLQKERERLSNTDSDRRAKQEMLEQLRRQYDLANHETSRLRSEANELRQRENALSNDKRLAESLVQRLADDLGGTESHLAELQSAISTAEEEFAKHQARARELAERLESLKAEAMRIQEEIGRDDQAKKELGKRLETITRDLGQATSRLQALRELEDSFEGYYRGVKEVMFAAGRGQLDGLLGVVSSLIKVPSELEVAAEVALGGDLQDIIAETVKDAKAAIQFLKQRNLGRATFLPLDFLHWDFPTQHLQRIWGRPGILGLARDMVEYDPKLKPAAYYLFGNTVFVETLDHAVALEAEGVRNRFVSLQGDVVNPRGVLTGGSHQTRGLLSRPREMRQLQDRVAVLEGDLKRLHDEMEATRSRLGQLYARAAELQSDIHKTQMEQATVSKDVQTSERDRRERRNQYASIEARITQQRLDRHRHEETIEKCAAGLAEIGAKLTDVQERIAAADANNVDLLGRVQRASEDAAVARQAEGALRQQVENLDLRLREARASFEEAARERDAREREKTTLLEEREFALLDRDEAELRIGEHARAFEELDNQAGALSAESETRANELRASQSEAQRLVRERNERDNAVREVDLQCAELKAQIEYVEREAEDEFALTLAEVAAELEAAEAADQQWRERKAEEEARRKEEKRAARRGATAPAAVPQEQPAAVEGESAPAPAEGEVVPAAEGEAAPVAAEGEAPVEVVVVAPAPPAKAVAADSEDEEDAAYDETEPPTTPEDDAITEPAPLRAVVADLRQKLQRLGAVNEAAIEEYASARERLGFLTEQQDDLVAAKQQLVDAIARIDETTKQMFAEALEAIQRNFRDMFQRLFNGGTGELVLVQDEKYPEPGIDIFAQPPGKKIGGSITLMSGGEKALTAIALMFALFQYRPSPICILDEIDAPLDDVNCQRMCAVLKAFARDTQFLIITHNKITMALADSIYGVTMQEPGVSKVVSVKFDEVEDHGLLEPVAAG